MDSTNLLGSGAPAGSGKGFFKKPEAVPSLLFGGGIIAGVGYGLFHLMPFINILLSNLITGAALVVVLAIMAAILLDKRNWKLGWFIYRSIMKKITGIFIDNDPVSICDTYIENLESKREDMNAQRTLVKQQKTKLGRQIEDNRKSAENAFRIAEQAKITNNQRELSLQTATANALLSSNANSLTPLYDRLVALDRILSKTYDDSEYAIQNLRNMVSIKKTERAAMMAGSSAVKSAMSILKGDDTKYLFDEGMETMGDNISNGIAQIESFMENSKHVLDSIDLQRGADADEGLKRLEEWEKTNNINHLLQPMDISQPARIQQAVISTDTNSDNNNSYLSL